MSSPAFKPERLLLHAAVALLLGAALAGMIEPVASMFRHISRDYNEGWNGYWSDIAWAGGTLYPPKDAAVANNYPPLSFYVVGLLGKMLGDSIVAGRLIATVSLFLVACNVFLWLGLVGAARGAALFGAALVMAAFVRYAPGYIAVDDPQLLAHAMVLSGITLLWKMDFSASALLGAALLMILGGLTKHLLVPIPVAVTAWIALYRREKLLLWLGSSTLLLALALLALELTYGAAFFDNMSASRLYSTHLMSNAYHRLRDDLRPVLVASLFVIAVVAGPGAPRRLHQGAAFALIYLVVSAVVGALASGGAGVDRNTYFDLLIAACLCAAVALDYFLANPHAGAALAGASAATAALAIATILALHAGARWPSERQELRQAPAREAVARADIDVIKTLGHGHAACETLALCYWAKSPLAVDFYNFGQKLAVNGLPPTACERVFLGDIDLVQIESPAGSPGKQRLPAYCTGLIMNRFSRVRESPDGMLWVKR